jgi:hypothetical protein
MRGLIWWLWTAFSPPEVHTFDVIAAGEDDDPDVAWLGELAWTARADNAGTGLR